MKYTSDLLFRILRATRTPQLDGFERDLEVPAAMVPVLSPVGPTPQAQNGLVSDEQRESFWHTIRLGNSGVAVAFTQTLAVFARGLWHFEALLSCAQSFTVADFSVTGGCRLQLIDPDANITSVLEAQGVANVPAYLRASGTWLVERDGWTWRASVPATAAGQTVAGLFAVHGNRLN